ncbi:MAG: hypothetical protein EOO47_17535 [Flavobacterium sp.]|nr:MAG: hypothetical protein EOO47_17535 [Flavobacterium sp.]
MKKFFLFFCYLLVLSFCASSQVANTIVDEYGHPANYRVNAFKSKIDLFLSVGKETKAISPFNYIPGDPLGTLVYLNGATTAKVTTRLRADSLAYYRYSIIENDTVLKLSDAKLTKVDFVWNERSDFPGYLTMDLGVSLVKNKKVTVKIYRLPNATEVTTLIIYNKPLPKSKLVAAYLFEKADSLGLKTMLKLRNDEKVSITDTIAGIFLERQKVDLDFAQNLLIKYSSSGKSYTLNLPSSWEYNTYDGNPSLFIDAINFKNPGDYEILLQNNVSNFYGFEQPQPYTILKFTVEKPFAISLTELFIAVAIVALIALLLILIIKRRNRSKLLTLNLKQELTKSELNTVRAQLNPHFVFNALSGIQNLMNNGSAEQANNYLGKFANLTRAILDERELISIDDEIKLLKDYISMEQLRFSFVADFKIDEEESFRYTDIPSMLLQPFVENAVKHGVATLKGEGRIEIGLFKEQQNIILMVKDNGKGFDKLAQTKGLGLKLSEKRIALLNTNYKNCPIELKIDSSSGTTVKIILNNWLI